MSFEQVLSWWSFVFLGVVVYSLGEGAKKLVKKIGWVWLDKFFTRTIVLHAPIAATAGACAPGFPLPDGLPETLLTRALFGLVAGICSSYSYKALKRVLGRDTKSKGESEEA